MGPEYNMEKIRSNNIWLGTISGIIVPVIIYIIVNELRRPDLSLGAFTNALYTYNALPKLISLCLLPNLILFFIFLKTDKLDSAKGVILSLFVYAIPILILKFI
jgi:hypothetical protein